MPIRRGQQQDVMPPLGPSLDVLQVQALAELKQHAEQLKLLAFAITGNEPRTVILNDPKSGDKIILTALPTANNVKVRTLSGPVTPQGDRILRCEVVVNGHGAIAESHGYIVHIDYDRQHAQSDRTYNEVTGMISTTTEKLWGLLPPPTQERLAVRRLGIGNIALESSEL